MSLAQIFTRTVCKTNLTQSNFQESNLFSLCWWVGAGRYHPFKQNSISTFDLGKVCQRLHFCLIRGVPIYTRTWIATRGWIARTWWQRNTALPVIGVRASLPSVQRNVARGVALDQLGIMYLFGLVTLNTRPLLAKPVTSWKTCAPLAVPYLVYARRKRCKDSSFYLIPMTKICGICVRNTHKQIRRNNAQNIKKISVPN